jgi:hypothetical protein
MKVCELNRLILTVVLKISFCSIERDSLLRNPAEGTSRSLGERVNTVAQEPLTPLTKTLLVLALVLLLTSSVRLKHAKPLGHLTYPVFIIRSSLAYSVVLNID